MYFAANKVKRKKRVVVFLNVISRETYSILQNLSSPDKPAGKTLKELMGIL